MACSGGHCSYHDTGTTTCSGHRTSCSTNRAISLSAEFADENTGRILATDVETLRANIRNEVDRWNLHPAYNVSLQVPGGIATSDDITDETVEGLRKMLADLTAVPPYVDDNDPGSDPATISEFTDKDQQPIDDQDWAAGIYDVYEQIRQNCICNADCSCNAVCACHNDCGCNYSDQRLKTDIEYL